MPISPIKLYKLYHLYTVYPYTRYNTIRIISYTWYMLILDIPLYVVDVHMPIGLYSSIVYRYAIVIWLYKKSRHGTTFSSVSAQKDKRCYSQKSSSDC